MKKWLRLASVLIPFLSIQVLADDIQSVDQSEGLKNTQIGMDIGYAALSTDTASVNAILFNIEGKYAFQPKVAVAVVGAQSYDISELTSVYTALAVKLSYAFTGSFLRNTQDYTIGSTDVVSAVDYSSGTFFADLSARQVFFNGSTRAVPLSGVGLDVQYQFGSSSDISYRAGFGYEFLSNGVETISPIRFHFGVFVWL